MKNPTIKEQIEMRLDGQLGLEEYLVFCIKLLAEEIDDLKDKNKTLEDAIVKLKNKSYWEPCIN